MKFRRLFVLLFVIVFALFLVACGGDKPEDDKPQVDPLVPTAISLKVKTAKVQINTELKLTYTITPATAQGDAVTVSVNNDLGTAFEDSVFAAITLFYSIWAPVIVSSLLVICYDIKISKAKREKQMTE